MQTCKWCSRIAVEPPPPSPSSLPAHCMMQQNRVKYSKWYFQMKLQKCLRSCVGCCCCCGLLWVGNDAGQRKWLSFCMIKLESHYLISNITLKFSRILSLLRVSRSSQSWELLCYATRPLCHVTVVQKPLHTSPQQKKTLGGSSEYSYLKQHKPYSFFIKDNFCVIYCTVVMFTMLNPNSRS